MSATREVALLSAILLPLAVAAQIRIDERVDVTRVLVDVRVTDARGRPIRGLETSEFVVELDGTPARVEWTRWVGSDGPVGAGSSRDAAGRGTRAVRGASVVAEPAVGVPFSRQLVFLFQKDLASSRVNGLLRMMRESERFVDRLDPDDRVAVLVFDSRLRVWQEFTTDHDRLRAGLSRGIFVAPPADEPTGPSLRERLAAADGAAAYTPERALLAIGRALEPLPGAKSLILFGYGFGTLHAPFGDLRTTRADLDRDYELAREALVAARVTVFALDISNADFHSLETSLMEVAEETGGFYSRTHDFPIAAMDRLDGSLQGYYVLAVEKPPSVLERRGRHTIKVRTTLPEATVLARRYYLD